MKKSLLLAIAAVCGLAGVQKMAAKNELYAVLSSDKTTVTFYYDSQRSSNGGSTNWGMDLYAGCESKITSVTLTTSVKEARPTTGYHFFYNLYNLTEINNLDYLNTSEMTNMEKMFYNCAKLTSINLSGFSTSKVQTMSNMFNNCRGVESLDLTAFNTDNVTSMAGMFYNCLALTTIKVNTQFNTGEVKDMSNMFSGCVKLDISELVKDFNTSNVTDMASMFSGCEALTSLDLRGWEMDNVTKTNSMFNGCSNLTTIHCDNDYSSSFTSSTNMFSGCTSLQGNKGTSYTAEHVDASYAHPDGGTGAPGYFTSQKATGIEGYQVGDTEYSVQKVLRNGQLFIHRDDKTYTAQGQEVK